MVSTPLKLRCGSMSAPSLGLLELQESHGGLPKPLVLLPTTLRDATQFLRLPHHLKCPGPGWAGLGAIWISGRCWGWKWIGFSHPNPSVIL